MMTIQKIVLVVLALMMAACGDDDLPEDYVVVGNKILALRVEAPEASPGDRVSMKLLVAGPSMDQNSLIPVTWRIGDPNGDVFHEEAVPYNEEVIVDVPIGILGDKTWMDVPVRASVTLDSGSLSAFKRFRVTHTPVGANPRVSSITANWISGNTHHTNTLMQDGSVTVDDTVFNIAFSAVMADLPDGANDSPVYSWYYTRSDNSAGELEVNDKKTVIEALLGEGEKAAIFRPSLVLSLYGEEAKETFQRGHYAIYLVVRDNASQSQGSASDRLGTDFYYFTLKVL